MATKGREVKSLHKIGRLSRKKAAKAAITVGRDSTSSKTTAPKGQKSVIITKGKTATGRKAVTFRAATSKKQVVKGVGSKKKEARSRKKTVVHPKSCTELTA